MNMRQSKNSRNFKNNQPQREQKARKKLSKEDFYPNHYNKDVISDCLHEFGSIAKNPYYTKSERKKIAISIKRLRILGQLPFCAKHYFQIFKGANQNIKPVISTIS